MSSTITSVKGTRDFYPDEMSFQRWLRAIIERVSTSFGYQEYDGPYLERIDLYAAKSGEELVKEQAFVFPDRSGDLIALRPELTPSLARMIASKRNQLPAIIRWWSYGPFWRYERPQRGRGREFFQWNIDLLGVDSPQADAEIAAIGAAFFREAGLLPSQVRIKFNNRRLVDTQLELLEVPKGKRIDVFRLIDRRDKMNTASWESYALDMGLTKDQLQALSALLQNKDAWKESEELVTFQDALTRLGVMDYFEYDPSVIRGLDYYTGTVFEARDADGDLRAILGGGRYDNLVADVGGDPIAGVGFAMGDMVVRLLLDEFDLIPAASPNPADVLIATFDASCWDKALEVSAQLREAGIRTEWYAKESRLPKQFKYADRQGIPYALVIGPDELEAGVVTIKDLKTREQFQIPGDQAADCLRSRMGNED